MAALDRGALVGGPDDLLRLAASDAEAGARKARRAHRISLAIFVVVALALAWRWREELISNPWNLLWSLPGFLGAALLQHIVGIFVGLIVVEVTRRFRPYSYTPNYYGDEPEEDFGVPPENSEPGSAAA